MAGAAAYSAPDAHEQAHAPPLGPEAIAAAHARVTSKEDHLRIKRTSFNLYGMLVQTHSYNMC